MESIAKLTLRKCLRYIICANINGIIALMNEKLSIYDVGIEMILKYFKIALDKEQFFGQLYYCHLEMQAKNFVHRYQNIKQR